MKVETIGVPVSWGQLLYLYGEIHVPLVRSRANRVNLNPFSYEVLKVQCVETINMLTWINEIADPLHFGYWGGLPAKIIWFVMGLGISSLVISGIRPTSFRFYFLSLRKELLCPKLLFPSMKQNAGSRCLPLIIASFS